MNRRGKIFSWGSNIHGQCAQQTKKTTKIPEIVKDSNGNIEPYASASYVSPKLINFDDFGNFKQLQCCEDSTFFVDENGNAFSCGDNSKGLLCLGYTSEIDKPKIISEFKGRVKEIRSTFEHQILVTLDNEVYIWPYENYFKNLKPSKIQLDKKIIINSVTCGKNFAIILSKTGIVYSFGSSNINGELGHGDNEPRQSPTPIVSLAGCGEKIVQISCGFKHTIAKSSTGKAFSWGCVSLFFYF